LTVGLEEEDDDDEDEAEDDEVLGEDFVVEEEEGEADGDDFEMLAVLAGDDLDAVTTVRLTLRAVQQGQLPLHILTVTIGIGLPLSGLS